MENNNAKFTFKKSKRPSGLSRISWKQTCDIKLKNLNVGHIHKCSSGGYEIMFRSLKDNIKEDGNPNCPWRWITLKLKHESIDAAIAFVRERNNDIKQQINFPTS